MREFIYRRNPLEFRSKELTLLLKENGGRNDNGDKKFYFCPSEKRCLALQYLIEQFWFAPIFAYAFVPY